MSVKLDLTPSPTVQNSQHLVPISEATAEKLKYKMREAWFAQKDQLNEGLRQREAARAKIAQADKNIAQADKNIAQADKNIALADKNIAQADKNIEACDEKLAEIQTMKTEADQRLQEIQQEREKIEKQKRQVLTGKFYLIFDTSKKSDLTAKKIETLFAAYLADGCIVIEKREGKSVMVIKSWEGVVKYLRDNPKVTSCNFSEFIIEANDTSKLTDLLAASNSLIGKVTYKGAIPQDADTALKAAKLARRGSLEIELNKG